VTLVGIAVRNAFLRNKTRALLTIAGVFVAAFMFVFLRTVVDAWHRDSEAAASDRLVTRNAISLTQPLPLSYKDRIAAIQGVSKVNWSNWFGGYYVDKRDFFAQFAIDGQSAFEVFGFRIVDGTKQAFLEDQNTCLLGKKLYDKLSQKYGIKLGSEIPLVSEIYPGDWKFRVAATVESDDASVANNMWFHWKRFNEGLRPEIKDRVGIFTVLVNDAKDSPRVAKAIDDTFANSDYETHTETEKAFRLQFVAGSSAILTAIEGVSLIILVIMALILGNTMAMSLRERTSELGALRAIGFLPGHVQRLAWVEGAALGLIGGLLGIAASNPMLTAFGQFVAGLGFLAGLRFSPQTGILAVGISCMVGLLASAAPAYLAGRIPVVDALRRQE
jgi:putative ABC transport system permease protein